MVTDKEIESALDNKYDGVDSFLLVQEILELQAANAKLKAENERLAEKIKVLELAADLTQYTKEQLQESPKLKTENKKLREQVEFYHRQVDGFVKADKEVE